LAGRIFTIEIVPELAQSAAALLKSLGVRNSSDCLYCSLWRCINITE
jgi:hypothetical protein